MFQPSDETARQAGFIPEGADYSALEDTPELDFIPDDPAELRCAVTDMAARINVADWRFIKLIAAMDRRRGWVEHGYYNLGNWLDHRCGLGPCAVRERIRIGRALARLPRIDGAFRDGDLSYSKVRAITRVATPETEEMLLSIADRSSAAQLESLVRTYQRVDRSNGERLPSEERRGLSWHYEDGMLVVTAAVPAERGALLVNALQKIVDARADERETYYQSLLGAVGGPEILAADGDLRVDDQSDAEPVPEPRAPDPVSHEEHPIVAADAPGDVSAETARDLPAGAEDLPATLAFELASTRQRFADALVDMAEHYLANGPGCRERRTGRRYEVVLTIGRNELAAQSSAGGARYHVDPDWGIDEEDARQVACDADVTEFIQDARGNLLNYERRRRIVPRRLLRALKLRDHNRCRFPGCPHQRYVEAHHVRHWIDGGETRLDNLVLLCSAHHRLLHHGTFHISVEDDEVVFVSRDGEVLEPALRPRFSGSSWRVSAPVSDGTQLLGLTPIGA